MYRGKTIAVCVPAHNEEKLIGRVIDTCPSFVDHIIIANDVSNDSTESEVRKRVDESGRVVLINHEVNQGVGGAIATGYKWARDHEIDITVVMAGDAQMDPDDMPALLDPVVDDEVDYSKGNRLFTGEAFQKIPKVRYFGNAGLSFMTKIASGYWHVADSQTGYTAINLKALKLIDWDKMYKRYGQPNDLLVKLNIFDMRVKDVPIKPVYGVGEVSGIKIHKVVYTIPKLLLKLFVHRMVQKYVIRNFHPLVFFYMLGFLFGLLTVVLFARLSILFALEGYIYKVNALAAMFSFMASSQFTLFAMWFDMEANKHLR